MKNLVVLVCTLLFWQNLVFAEQKPIGIKSSKDQDEQVRTFRSIIISVTGFYDTGTGEVTLYFHRPIGKATVTLTDETGFVVFSQIIATDMEDVLEFSLPKQTGIYMLSIVSDIYEGIGGIVL